MKAIHHLKTRWLFAAMVAAVLVGEIVTWYASQMFNVRFPGVAAAAVCIGLVAVVVAVLYDGND